MVSTPRYEEVAHYRQELDEAKRENEGLKERIRELERMIRLGGEGDALRGRGAPMAGQEDAAVTASVHAAGGVADGEATQ